MSFTIFVAGSGHYHRHRTGVDFGDVYEFADGLSQMSSVTGGARSFVEDEVTGAVTPDSPLQQILNMVGRINSFHLLNDAVRMMGMSMAPVSVSVSARVENTLWADTSSFSQITLFSGENNSAGEFFRSVNPGLERVGMNTFGVLSAIAAYINDFSSTSRPRGSDGLYRLTFQLSA